MTKKYSFIKYQPWGLRSWHWLNALVILGLLGTVFLRKTFLNWHRNADIIEQHILKAGETISHSTAVSLAKEMRDLMWEWHVYMGFALGILLLYRLLVGVLTKRMPGQMFCQSARDFIDETQQKSAALHYFVVKTGYAMFYLVSLFMVISGLMMAFSEPLHISQALHKGLKEIHEMMMWFFVVFTVGHILGVVIAELRQDRGLVSGMIHGGDKD